MPFTHNADRQHKFDKAQFKVTNWPQYNESLRRRGDITVWVEESVATSWFAPAGNRRGRPAKYSELAIETCLRVRSAYGFALRQTQGFVRSVFALMGLTLPVPDSSTLSRRAGCLKLSRPKLQANSGPVTLVIDSTGVKMFGAGEWLETKYGTKKKRRIWRKLHLGLDLESGMIVCSELTEDTVGDPTVVPDLLDQIEGPVATFLGDGAYDGSPTRQEIADRYDGVEIIIPPPKTAVPSPEAATAPSARDRDIFAIEKHGRIGWQKQTGYGRRSRGETLMGRYKQVIGTTLKSRKFENQKTEAKIAVSVLNTMTALGRPTFERVAVT
ncbi:IS5 family transposase [Pseudovibrio sp. Tun.PSC04-5.I4]|uniref:IS5 family transposase n=1 Tax=Pseudovibrio sp. Tun.PSC04-5.I4 TaxID=1798213 RepID=UPI00087FBDD1|nr:IS5 family transposase [Pseudovibrio sp. Tun.PSC04-5.I4]SDR45278.1 Transposase DDE domain-containing protein [Pseudovibrio sp. Tun.PSC04-5.I4]